jgi:hypothetical protein
MSIEEGYKRIYANDLAAGLGFEWDYEEAQDHDLYEAIEVQGYEWDGTSWLSPERQRDAARLRASQIKKPRRKKPNVQQQLEQWNAGKPIRSK